MDSKVITNKNKENFNWYSIEENFNNTWLNRFIYNSKNSISIIDFEKENNVFQNMKICTDIKEFFNIIDKLSNLYAKWCIKQNTVYIEKQIELQNFFKGAIGEYFFTFFLNHVKCMIIENYKTGNSERFEFEYVYPRLDMKDDGVDLIGNISYGNEYIPAVIQVKFWSIYNKAKITMDIFQKAIADGIINDFINQSDNKNIVVCWLGNKKDISTEITKNNKYMEHAVFIDKSILDNSINNQMINFCEELKNELCKISLFK